LGACRTEARPAEERKGKDIYLPASRNRFGPYSHRPMNSSVQIHAVAGCAAVHFRF